MPIKTEPSDITPYQRFEDAMKSILTVSKEEVEKREKQAKETKEKSGKKRHSF